MTTGNKTGIDNLWELLNNKNWSPTITVSSPTVNVTVAAAAAPTVTTPPVVIVTNPVVTPVIDKAKTGYTVLGVTGSTFNWWVKWKNNATGATKSLQEDGMFNFRTPGDWLATLYGNSFAKGGVYKGGMALMGERGPELVDSSPGYVYRADETKALFDLARRGVVAKGAADNRETVAELKEQNRLLRELLAEQHAANIAIANNTGKTAKRLDRWDGDGMPDVRAVA